MYGTSGALAKQCFFLALKSPPNSCADALPLRPRVAHPTKVNLAIASKHNWTWGAHGHSIKKALAGLTPRRVREPFWRAELLDASLSPNTRPSPFPLVFRAGEV
jgi:hypothetical protein